MPFRNFHSFRVKSKGAFKGALKTRSIAPGITILHGLLKAPPKKKDGEGKVTGRVVQTYRFNRKNYTFSKAKSWMNKNKVKFILSEKAAPIKNESLKPVVTLEELAEELRKKLNASIPS